jgi:hypothetical protein
MTVEKTSDFNTTSTVPPEVSQGDTISAETFTQMLDVLESLATHNHIFYDDCSRGTL